MKIPSKAAGLLLKVQNLFAKNDNRREMDDGAPTLSCEDVLSRCLYNASKSFNAHNTISRIERLVYVQYIICAIELLLNSRDEFYTVSTEFAIQAFQRISNIPTLWEPLIRDPIVIKIMCSVRAHDCCEVILNTIIRTIDRIRISVGRGSGDATDLLLHELRHVSIQPKIALQLQSLRYPSSVGLSDNFHYALKCVQEGDVLVPMRLQFMIRIFNYFHCDPPRYFAAANSSLVVKVDWPLAAIIANSTDPICQICHGNLDSADCVIVLPACNHVCCRTCQEKWFYTLFKKNRPWHCATCQQRTVESCSVYRDGTKVVHINCDAAGAYVKFVINEAAKSFDFKEHFGQDPNWLNF